MASIYIGANSIWIFAEVVEFDRHVPIKIYERVAELVDALALGASGATHGGSSPLSLIFIGMAIVRILSPAYLYILWVFTPLRA